MNHMNHPNSWCQVFYSATSRFEYDENVASSSLMRTKVPSCVRPRSASSKMGYAPVVPIKATPVLIYYFVFFPRD